MLYMLKIGILYRISFAYWY